MRTLLYSSDQDSAQEWVERLTSAGSELQMVGEDIGPSDRGDVLIVVNPASFDTIRHFRHLLPAWTPLLIAGTTFGVTPDEWLEAGASDILQDGIESAQLKMRLGAASWIAQRFKAAIDLERQSQSTLTSGLVHDFNNVLSAIQGNVDLSLMNPLISGELRYSLDQISKATDQAVKLMRQVLEGSRQSEGVLPPLNVNEALRRFRFGMGKVETGYGVEFKLDRNVPLVRMGYGILIEAISAIIELAKRILPANGGALEIATREAPDGSPLLEVAVRGADERASLANYADELAAAVKGIKAAGGSVSLPTPHAVRLTIPALGKQAGNAGSTAVELPNPGLGTILLVLDKEAVRTATHQVLKREGYTVLEADSGEEGLALFRSVGGMIDAVVLDFDIPGTDSRELLRQMQRTRPNVHLVVWSGLAQDVARTRLNGFAEVDVIKKPAELAEFPQVLKLILQKDKTPSELKT